MKKGSFLVALAVLAAGCGGVSFAGTYKGPVSQAAGSCSDGSTLPASNGDWTLTLTEPNDGEVEIDSDACPGVRGTVNGNTVTTRQATCPPKTLDNGATLTATYTGGTLTLDGSTLDVSFAVSLHVSANGASGTCTTTQTAKLALQSE